MIPWTKSSLFISNTVFFPKPILYFGLSNSVYGDASQALVSSFEEAENFIKTLSSGGKCVVKPYRGVASDGVYCCETMEEASAAFEALIGSPQYGGGVNDAVLVQVRYTQYAHKKHTTYPPHTIYTHTIYPPRPPHTRYI
jgi:hypothetical protein